MTNQAIDIWEAAYVLASNATRLAHMSPTVHWHVLNLSSAQEPGIYVLRSVADLQVSLDPIVLQRSHVHSV